MSGSRGSATGSSAAGTAPAVAVPCVAPESLVVNGAPVSPCQSVATSDPPTTAAATPTPAANLSFNQVITLKVPSTRAATDEAAAAPLAAVVETVAASPAGAACTEFAETAPAMSRGRQRHAAFHEIFSQLFQRAAHALVRRRFAQLQCRGDFLRGFVFKEPQHDGVAVGFAQPPHGFVQQRRDLFPSRRVRFGQSGLHISLLFAALAADFALHKIGRRQPRGLIKPAGQHACRAADCRLCAPE